MNSPVIRLRQGEAVTVYDRKKRIYCRFKPIPGEQYTLSASRDNLYFETWPVKLTLKDCINILGEISEHNAESSHPGQVNIGLN